MVYLIYIFIVLVATTLGSSIGLGGGVIIKPLLDLVNMHDASAISFYSACAVFTMSVVSIIKVIKRKEKIDYKIVLLFAIGSIAGGFIGDAFFVFINHLLKESVKIVQNALLCIVLFLIALYFESQVKHKLVNRNPLVIVLSGLVLGIVSVFLGIGGGPLNLAVLDIVLGMDIKNASVYSIGIIFFSQATKLIKTFVTNRFLPYDLKFLVFILPVAVLGGIIGSTINKKADNEKLKNIYIYSLLILIVISLLNIIKTVY